MDGIESGAIKTVIVYALDRFSRSQIQTLQAIETIRRKEANFFTIRENISITGGSADLATDILISTLSLMAKNERETIKSRTSVGKLRKTNAGLWVKGQSPVGYETDPATQVLKINDAEAALVRRIFSLRVNGQGVNSIVKRLTLEKAPYFENRVRFSGSSSRYCSVVVKQRNSKYCRIRPHNPLYAGCASCAQANGGVIEENRFWCKTSITRILKNRCYIGQIHLNGDQNTWVSGKHEPLVDVETFDLIQKLFKDNRSQKRRVSFSNPLAGRVFCKQCGRPMHVTTGGHGRLTKSGVPAKDYVAFRCTGRKVGICSQSNILAEKVYETVFSWIESFLDSEDTRNLIADILAWIRDNYSDDVERGLKEVQAQIKAANREIDNLNVAYMRAVRAGIRDETLDSGVLAELKKAQELRSSLNNDLLRLEARKSKNGIRGLDKPDLFKESEEILSNLLEGWRSCQTRSDSDSPEEKSLKASLMSQVVKGLVERIDIEGQEHSVTIGYNYTMLKNPEYGRFAQLVHLAYLASDQDKLLDII